MKEEYTRGAFSGYRIGNDMLIHSHINDPESWFLTVRKLDIFALRICSKSVEKHVLARLAYTVLSDKADLVAQLMSEVKPFTHL